MKIVFANKKMEADKTLYALQKWHKSLFRRYTYMVVELERGDVEKVSRFVERAERLIGALERKLAQLQDADTQNDVEIMLDEAKLLLRHVQQDVARARPSTGAQFGKVYDDWKEKRASEKAAQQVRLERYATFARESSDRNKARLDNLSRSHRRE